MPGFRILFKQNGSVHYENGAHLTLNGYDEVSWVELFTLLYIFVLQFLGFNYLKLFTFFQFPVFGHYFFVLSLKSSVSNIVTMLPSIVQRK